MHAERTLFFDILIFVNTFELQIPFVVYHLSYLSFSAGVVFLAPDPAFNVNYDYDIWTFGVGVVLFCDPPPFFDFDSIV